MTTGRLFRGAMVAAFTLFAGCKDSTAPQIELTEAQVDDLMDAFSALGTADVGTAANMAALVVNVGSTIDCPNGGSRSETGSMNINEETGSLSITATQDFAACKAMSSTGRLWTFDGSPSLTSTFNMTVNQTTNAFTMQGTQTGGLMVASDLGSGVCNFDLTTSMTGTPGANETMTIAGSISGTVCGKTIQVSIDISG
jgi:hypothetical protein